MSIFFFNVEDFRGWGASIDGGGFKVWRASYECKMKRRTKEGGRFYHELWSFEFSIENDNLMFFKIQINLAVKIMIKSREIQIMLAN